MLIASNLPGRLRLRGVALRLESERQSACQALTALDPSVTIEAGTHCGSLLVRYDPARLAPATLLAWVEQQSGARPAAAARAASPAAAPAGNRRRISREANRAAKYGLLASTAVMLLALAGNTRLHAAAGGLNLAFLLVHLAHHRGKLLK